MLELRQGERVECFGGKIVIQPAAIGAAIEEPDLVVLTSDNSVQANFFRERGRRIKFCVGEGLDVEASQAAAGDVLDLNLEDYH